jgi:hypothetical protein
VRAREGWHRATKVRAREMGAVVVGERSIFCSRHTIAHVARRL